VVTNDFLEGGGDGFVGLTHKPIEAWGPLDGEALSDYLSHRAGLSGLPAPLAVAREDRIELAHDRAPRLCTPSPSRAR